MAGVTFLTRVIPFILSLIHILKLISGCILPKEMVRTVFRCNTGLCEKERTEKVRQSYGKGTRIY